ncbi:hypothetical protein Ddc_11292 [Ditylenchus destructor]|nr:hypothetical protein Ddc_11292 [Ditylenchus destructor]
MGRVWLCQRNPTSWCVPSQAALSGPGRSPPILYSLPSRPGLPPTSSTTLEVVVEERKVSGIVLAVAAELCRRRFLLLPTRK